MWYDAFMQNLHFSIQINAPVERVWDVLLSDATFREWTAPFAPGSYYEGSWEQGSNIRFLAPEEDGTLSGMLSRIAENRPHEFISIEHYGAINKGVEDTTSDDVKKWAGMHENYTLRDIGAGKTEVLIDVGVASEEEKDMFARMWPEALEKLKQLAEKS